MSEAIPPYIATIRNVREVALRGTAAAPFWQERLHDLGLQPQTRDGLVELTISTTSARFCGWPFHEVAFAITLEPSDAWGSRPAIYLIHAFNSSRVLGWMERQFFSTPYFYAQANNQLEPTLGFRVQERESVLCQAQMASALPAPLQQGFERWAGAIYLPPVKRARAGKAVFFAELSGETATYPYRMGHDTWQFVASDRWPIFGWLEASRFQGVEWSVRRAAVHARSKTVYSQ